MTDVSSRDLALIALRPDVPSADPDRADSAIEAFLHGTLRPVLKLQNGPLLALTAHHIAGLVKGFSSLDVHDQHERLGAVMRKDNRLKRMLTGVVFGALTTEELSFALAHDAEVRRRIAALLAERVVSQTEVVADRIEALQSA